MYHGDVLCGKWLICSTGSQGGHYKWSYGDIFDLVFDSVFLWHINIHTPYYDKDGVRHEAGDDQYTQAYYDTTEIGFFTPILE